MTKNNNGLIPIEKQKLVEEIRELTETSWWQEYQSQVNKSNLSSAARNKVISKSGSDFASERGKDGYGPMMPARQINYISAKSFFKIEFKISNPLGSNENLFFELPGGEYTNIWKIKGDIDELREKEDWLYDGRAKIVKLNPYRRVEREEESIKHQLHGIIRNFELQDKEAKRRGEVSNLEVKIERHNSEVLIHSCPKLTEWTTTPEM